VFSIVDTPTSSVTILDTHARIAAVFMSTTATSPHCGDTRLSHVLRRVAAVFGEMWACERDHDAYTSMTVTRPVCGATYVPVASFAVISVSSHACASALRANAFACSRPSSST
jgi:hypothetical protein